MMLGASLSVNVVGAPLIRAPRISTPLAAVSAIGSNMRSGYERDHAINFADNHYACNNNVDKDK